jgi:Domain of unknown function DUF29
MSDLYDTDLVAWAERQAKALRRRADNEIDWDNVAEEIEDLAASRKREVRTWLRRICEHLLKWEHHQRTQPDDNYPILGRRDELTEFRLQLTELLEESPSLRRGADEALPRQFAQARQSLERKMGASLVLRDDNGLWSLDQVLSLDFMPDGPDYLPAAAGLPLA